MVCICASIWVDVGCVCACVYACALCVFVRVCVGDVAYFPPSFFRGRSGCLNEHAVLSTIRSVCGLCTYRCAAHYPCVLVDAAAGRRAQCRRVSFPGCNLAPSCPSGWRIPDVRHHSWRSRRIRRCWHHGDKETRPLECTAANRSRPEAVRSPCKPTLTGAGLTSVWIERTLPGGVRCCGPRTLT